MPFSGNRIYILNVPMVQLLNNAAEAEFHTYMILLKTWLILALESFFFSGFQTVLSSGSFPINNKIIACTDDIEATGYFENFSYVATYCTF